MRRRRSTTRPWVCSELFAPQLAVAYGKAMQARCTSYFEQITSFSVVVRRMLQDGDTAVLELRQTVQPRDWAVVLSRRPACWQAVELLPGRSGRADQPRLARGDETSYRDGGPGGRRHLSAGMPAGVIALRRGPRAAVR